MKAFYRIPLFVLSVIIVFSATISAQEDGDLNETLKKLAGSAAKAYITPVSNGFGANLNTGWSTRVPKAKIFGIDLSFGMVAMGSFMKDENKAFEIVGNYKFSYDQAMQLTEGIGYAQARQSIVNQITAREFGVKFSGPTFIGKEDDRVKVEFPGETFSYQGQSYRVNDQVIETPVGGLAEDLNIVPLASPQITVGTIYGTQASFRFLPKVKLDDKVGELNFFGFGIQHNPGVWFANPLPVDVAVGFFTQKLKIGDLLESSATEYGIYASKTWGPGGLNITPYMGFAFENATMTATYDYSYRLNNLQKVTERISFDLESENTTKLTFGTAFKLAFISLSVDYNIAKYSSVGVSLGTIF